MSTFQNERLVAGAMSVGQMLKAIEFTTDYVRQRQAFGKALWDQQVVRNKLSWMAAKTAAVRALVSPALLLEDAEKALATALCEQAEVKPIGLGARDSLRLEADLPDALIGFHRGMAALLAERLSGANRLVRLLSD